MAAVYVLRTHFVDDTLLTCFRKMRADLGDDRVFMLLDSTSVQGAASARMYDEFTVKGYANSGRADVFTITEQECSALNPLHAMHNLPGVRYRVDTHIGAAAIALASFGSGFGCTDYEYMFMIEYDVACRGDWKRALQACDSVDADLLAKGGDDRYAVRNYHECPGWVWWNDVFGRVAEQVPVQERLGCFFPVVRLSKRMLDAVLAEFGHSTGYCEVYLPTLCVARGMKYVSLPHECIGIIRFEPNIDIDSQELLVGCRSGVDCLFHPVKINAIGIDRLRARNLLSAPPPPLTISP